MVLRFFFGILFCFAGAGPESLVKPFFSQVQLNQTILFEPVVGHQFNLKSPNQCGKGQLLQVSEQRVECTMSVSGQQTIELFVCDDQKTFCKREELALFVADPSGLKNKLNELFFRFQNLFGSKQKSG